MDHVFASAKTSFLLKEIGMTSDPIGCQLLSAGYELDPAHVFLASVPPAARVGAPVLLAGRRVESHVFFADNPLFAALTGPQVVSLILYQATGDDPTSRLIVRKDEGIGVPFTPDGRNVRVRWPAAGIFGLA